MERVVRHGLSMILPYPYWWALRMLVHVPGRRFRLLTPNLPFYSLYYDQVPQRVLLVVFTVFSLESLLYW